MIECTTAWQGGVQYTYVDEKGGRYNYKGGSKSKYSWEEYGLLTPYIEYSDNQEPKPIPNPPVEITFADYTVKKGDTLSKISKKHYGTTKKWKQILKKNKKVLNKAAKKHGRKGCSNGKYLYAGTKITLP